MQNKRIIWYVLLALVIFLGVKVYYSMQTEFDIGTVQQLQKEAKK